MANHFENPQTETPYLNNEKGEPGRELTAEEIRKKLRDPNFLPSHKLLAKYFKFDRENRYNDPEWKKWFSFMNESKHPVYEIWTKEYIHAFGTYLAQRVMELGGTEGNPTAILEVCAGDGRLTHFLQEKMNELKLKKVKLIASDSGDSDMPQVFPVENIDHKKALGKHKPRIVICSWMPAQYDCTAAFRATKNVDEYILIGRANSGFCGDEWQTWGKNRIPKNRFPDNMEVWKQRQNQLPPYKQDGFKKVYMNDLMLMQLSRLNIVSENLRTRTVSFKKIPSKQNN